MRSELNETIEYLTPKEIATRIGLKTARPVNEAINRGELPAFEPSYNHRIVREDDFHLWMDSKRVKASVAVTPAHAELQTTDLAETLARKTRKAKPSTAANAAMLGHTLHDLI